MHARSNSRLHTTIDRIVRTANDLRMMNRHRVVWSNFPGAPGYTNFYTGTSVTDSTPFKTFFNAAFNFPAGGLQTWLPNGTQLTFPASGDVINEADGKITGSWAGTAPSPLTSAATSGPFAGGAGAQVQWQTSLIVDGRRVLGKTFLVPMLPAAMDTNGSLSTTAVTTILAAANALVVALAGELKVFSRPRPTIAGANAQVIGARVPDLAVSLRSRRT